MDYTFDMAPEDLRQLGSSGWETYDEDHSADERLDAADDYYTGPSGPTRSATTFADSPMGIFF